MLQLDPTTLAALEAAATPTARAQAVLTSISGTITVTVYDGSGNVKGSGSMTKLGTLSANVIVLDPTTSFSVSSTGTPDPATWTIEFKNGSNKWMKGTFGLSSSPTAEFKWSLGTWTSGQAGTIANAYATVQKREVLIDVTDNFNVEEATSNSPPAWTLSTPSTLDMSLGGSFDFKPYAYDPDSGDTHTFSVTPTTTGISIPNGVLTIGNNAQIKTHTLTINVIDSGGLSDSHVCNVTVSQTGAIYYIPANGANNTRRTFTLNSSTGFNGSSWVTSTGQTKLPAPGDIIELRPGTHGVIRFNNPVGLSGKRYIIRGPQSGSQQAIVRRKTGAGGDFIFDIYGARYLHVNGYNPDCPRNCGIKIQNAESGTDRPSDIFKIGKVPKNVEVSYIEVYWANQSTNASGGGIAFSCNDHNNNLRALYPGEFVENINFHHNWTHEAGGFYIGPNYSWSFGDVAPLHRGDLDYLGLPLRNIRIEDNLIEFPQQEGITCKMFWEGNNYVRRNVIHDTGQTLDANPPQRVGISFQGTGTISENIIYAVNPHERAVQTPSTAIFCRVDNGPIQGQAYPNYNLNSSGVAQPYAYFQLNVFNNLVYDVHVKNGFSFNNEPNSPYDPQGRDTVLNRVYCYNNTAHDCDNYGFFVENVYTGSFLRNNIALGSGAANFQASNTIYEDLTINKGTGTDTAIFTNCTATNLAARDYSLKVAVPVAINSTLGVNVSTTDLSSPTKTRVLDTADMGAYERT